MKLYVALAREVDRLKRCADRADIVECAEVRVKELMVGAPSGAGFDNGTKLELEESTSCKLVFYTSFHHMDEGGGYDGWTEHKVVVTPTFDGIDVRVGGRDRNDIKDYVAENFDGWLRGAAPEEAWEPGTRTFNPGSAV